MDANFYGLVILFIHSLSIVEKLCFSKGKIANHASTLPLNFPNLSFVNVVHGGDRMNISYNKEIILNFNSTAATITANIDDPPCPGERLVYTCVSQGSSQRWRIQQNGGLLIDAIFIRGREPGSVIIRNPYTFTLISAMQNHFESTVSVVAAMSIHNTYVECTSVRLQDSITIKIAGISADACIIEAIYNIIRNNNTACVIYLINTDHWHKIAISIIIIFIE